MTTTESPIEEMFLQAIEPAARAFGFEFTVEAPEYSTLEDLYRVAIFGTWSGESRVFVFPQARLEPYRLDFLLVFHRFDGDIGPLPTAIAVECDGRQWHEKTPEQFDADRLRDAEILARYHVPTLRFAGRILYRDADALARLAIVTGRERIERDARLMKEMFSRARMRDLDEARRRHDGTARRLRANRHAPRSVQRHAEILLHRLNQLRRVST